MSQKIPIFSLCITINNVGSLVFLIEACITSSAWQHHLAVAVAVAVPSGHRQMEWQHHLAGARWSKGNKHIL